MSISFIEKHSQSIKTALLNSEIKAMQQTTLGGKSQQLLIRWMVDGPLKSSPALIGTKPVFRFDDHFILTEFFPQYLLMLTNKDRNSTAEARSVLAEIKDAIRTTECELKQEIVIACKRLTEDALLFQEMDLFFKELKKQITNNIRKQLKLISSDSFGEDDLISLFREAQVE